MVFGTPWQCNHRISGCLHDHIDSNKRRFQLHHFCGNPQHTLDCVHQTSEKRTLQRRQLNIRVKRTSMPNVRNVQLSSFVTLRVLCDSLHHIRTGACGTCDAQLLPQPFAQPCTRHARSHVRPLRLRFAAPGPTPQTCIPSHSSFVLSQAQGKPKENKGQPEHNGKTSIGQRWCSPQAHTYGSKQSQSRLCSSVGDTYRIPCYPSIFSFFPPHHQNILPPVGLTFLRIPPCFLHSFSLFLF